MAEDWITHRRSSNIAYVKHLEYRENADGTAVPNYAAVEDGVSEPPGEPRPDVEVVSAKVHLAEVAGVVHVQVGVDVVGPADGVHIEGG